MLAPLLALALSVSIFARVDTTDAPRDVVRRALVAVEGDSIAPVRARWTAGAVSAWEAGFYCKWEGLRNTRLIVAGLFRRHPESDIAGIRRRRCRHDKRPTIRRSNP